MRPPYGSRAFLLAALLVVAGCGPDPPSAPAERGKPRVEAPEEDRGPLVVFLGDSIAAGLHLPADEAFPAVLQRMLAAEGRPFRLINAGVSGDTSAGGLRRVGWILKQEPDWVVIELGGNDGLRGQPLESIEENLRAIVDEVQAAGAGAVLLGQVMPPNYGPEYTAGFAALYDRIAADYDLPYVPFFLQGVGGVPEMNLSDQLHPNVEGHRRIAERLAPVFRELIEEDRGGEARG